MSDPQFGRRPSGPAARQPDTSGGMWGWIAGIAVVVLIAIILIAGWSSDKNTASNAPATATVPITPPSATTGSAPNSAPMAPAIPAPAPAHE